MTRSAEEWEMSRSCQRAMFSKAAWALARTTRARPEICSLVMGLRLWGMARGALLLFGEELLGLADLGALEVADLGGDLVERGAEDGEGGDVGGVAVALDDLGGDGDGFETEFVADGFFVLGLEVAEGADGAGELADAEVFGGGVEAGEVALHLGVPEQELEAEGGGFGVDAVGAADDGGVLELEGAALEGVGEGEDAGADDARRLRGAGGTGRCRRRRWR